MTRSQLPALPTSSWVWFAKWFHRKILIIPTHLHSDLWTGYTVRRLTQNWLYGKVAVGRSRICHSYESLCYCRNLLNCCFWSSELCHIDLICVTRKYIPWQLLLWHMPLGFHNHNYASWIDECQNRGVLESLPPHSVMYPFCSVSYKYDTVRTQNSEPSSERALIRRVKVIESGCTS